MCVRVCACVCVCICPCTSHVWNQHFPQRIASFFDRISFLHVALFDVEFGPDDTLHLSLDLKQNLGLFEQNDQSVQGSRPILIPILASQVQTASPGERSVFSEHQLATTGSRQVSTEEVFVGKSSTISATFSPALITFDSAHGCSLSATLRRIEPRGGSGRSFGCPTQSQ